MKLDDLASLGCVWILITYKALSVCKGGGVLRVRASAVTYSLLVSLLQRLQEVPHTS